MKRRDFLKLSLGAGMAAAMPVNFMLSSCSNKDDDPTEPVNPDDGPDISGPADTLVLGNIITVDENKMFASAMTIKNGRVQYVGNQTYAEKLCDEHTERLDFGKLSVYPGFMEAHCHGSAAGLVENSIKLFDYSSYEQYTKVIKEYIEKHPDQPYYRISGWQNGDVPPTREILDAASTDKYIFGGSMDGHCFLMNTKTMEALQVDEEWCSHYDPKEAPVGKDHRPTGYLSESASAAVARWIPIQLDAAKDSILKWQQFAFQNGFVAATDAGVNLQSDVFHDAYLELVKEGKMKLRTRAFWNVVQADANEKTVEKIAKMKEECKDEYYKLIGIKVFIDGVIESHTALLHERYKDENTKGLDRYNRDKEEYTLRNLVRMAHEHGLSTHTHTIGDAAVTKMLDAIEYSKNATGKFEIRDMLAHIELIKPEDIKRFAKYNVSAVVAALWGPKNSITDYTTEVKLMGEERAGGPNYIAMNSFVKMGVNCAQHTDYPVSQAFGATRTIYCGVTRQLPKGGSATLRLAEEAVTRLEILKEMTINVAKTWNEENRLGSLTPGKIANFVVYNCDFIDDDAEKIPDAKLQHVYVDGKEVYKG